MEKLVKILIFCALLEARTLSEYTSEPENSLNNSLSLCTAGLEISKKGEELTVSDISRVGQIFKTLQKTRVNLEELTETVSNLQKAEKQVLQRCQENKTIDNIFRYFDEIVKRQPYRSPFNYSTENNIMLIQNIKEINFTGFVLDTSGNFSILTGDVTVEEIAAFRDLDSAVVLSSELKEQLNEDAVICLVIFFKDTLFIEEESQNRSINKIFDVLLPGVSNYSGPITVYQKVPSKQYQAGCAFWYYNDTQSGFWLAERDGEKMSSLIKCNYWHTTHFALLLIEQFLNGSGINPEILEWITNVNCFISLMSLSCIILTAVFFQKWRRGTGHKILLNFTAVMILQMIFFYVASIVNRSDDDFWCVLTGSLLHYFTLSQFYWMVIIALLQYKRYVDVFWTSPARILLKTCLCGWIFPIFHVATVFIFDADSYSSSFAKLCYPSGLGLALGVWLPILVILVVNLFIFTKIMWSLSQSSALQVVKSDYALRQWRLTFLLFFLLGLTWIFGFLHEFGDVFVYLFCWASTLQGFVIFLFFIVFDANTRFLYVQAFKKCIRRNT